MQRASMWFNLYGRQAVQHKASNMQKHKKGIFCLFYTLCWTAWWPYRLNQIIALHISLFYWPKDQSRSNSQNILRIDSFEKRNFFESAILDFFSKKVFFLLNPIKSSQRFSANKDGSKFWWLSWFPVQNNTCVKICNTV